MGSVLLLHTELAWETLRAEVKANTVASLMVVMMDGLAKTNADGAGMESQRKRIFNLYNVRPPTTAHTRALGQEHKYQTRARGIEVSAETVGRSLSKAMS